MDRAGDLVLVNGQTRPMLTERLEERERRRIVNACTARSSAAAGRPGAGSARHRLRAIAQSCPVHEIVLASDNRADLLVTATQGTSALQALGVDRGTIAGMQHGRTSGDVGTLAILQVTRRGAHPRHKRTR